MAQIGLCDDKNKVKSKVTRKFIQIYRKSMTRMAAMLGDSYVKFVGEYYFAASSEIKLRNPTKVIWKGFNRWSRYVSIWLFFVRLKRK